MALAVLIAVGAGCTDQPTAAERQPVIVAPGGPGDPGRILTEVPEPALGETHSILDVHFVHSMIAHHEQALEMTALVADRSTREDIILFARRIELSQAAEIARMEDWLAARGEPARDAAVHPAGTVGMLSPEQLAELAAARGNAFDRRFLELMILHHEGALTMVEQLRAVGGGQEAELFEMVNSIDADQRIEIARMRRLLAELPG